MKRLFAVLCLIIIPVHAFAAAPISRRDGFLEIWNSIRRPAEPFKTQFTDVPEPAKGSLEIDYATGRGVIDNTDDNLFHPDSPLTLGTALTWLLRSRSVTDDPKDVSIETMSGLLLRYPIAYIGSPDDYNQTISDEDLLTLMQMLDNDLVAEDHEVSLYSEKFNGKGTAFGESFDMYAMTAAHRSFPYNTLVKVTNIANGKSVTVRINDRGPYVSGRDMDLSLGAFTTIADRSSGKIRATFQRLGDVNLVGHCGGDSPEAQHLSKKAFLTRGVPHYLKLGDVMTLESNSPFVMRGVTYPDGNGTVIQNFINKGEHYEFKPSVEGIYHFTVGTIDGKMRQMEMEVVKCN